MMKSVIKNCEKSIPCGYKYIEDGIYVENGEDKGRRITNFFPIVLNKIINTDIHTKEIHESVELSAYCGQKICGSKIIEVSDIDKFDYQAELSSILYVDPFHKKTQKVLSSIVRYQLAHASAEKRIYNANRLGFFDIYIEGKIRHGYIAGNSCIGVDDLNVQISPELAKYELLPSKMENLGGSEAVSQYVKDLLVYNRRAPVLVAYDIVAILKSLFEKAGVPVKFSMYLRGEQSSGKTTMASLVCSIYNRYEDVEAHIHNLTASQVKLNHVLSQEADMVVIIDDLRRSDSAAIMRQQEIALDNLIRVAANNVGRETMNYEYDVRGAALFTGEYALKNPSTNNRIVLIELEKADLDKKKLRALTREPVLLSFFFKWFIEWAIEHYDDIESFIRDENDRYLQLRERRELIYQERLNKNGNILSIAYRIFWQFCLDNGWKDMPFDEDSFDRLMENLIYEQIESLELDGKESRDYVVELYFRVYSALDIDERCTKNPQNTGWRQELYYDEGKNLVYIPGATLEDYLSEIKAPISVFCAINEFEVLGLLEMDNSKKRVRTKKCASRRCYVINYLKWSQYVKEVVESER